MIFSLYRVYFFIFKSGSLVSFLEKQSKQTKKVFYSASHKKHSFKSLIYRTLAIFLILLMKKADKYHLLLLHRLKRASLNEKTNPNKLILFPVEQAKVYRLAIPRYSAPPVAGGMWGCAYFVQLEPTLC